MTTLNELGVFGWCFWDTAIWREDARKEQDKTESVRTTTILVFLSVTRITNDATCSIWIGTNLTGPTPYLNMAHAPVGCTQAHHNSVVQNKHTHTHSGRLCIEVVAP